MFKSIREYENLHIALWLLKDMFWVVTLRTLGMIMIVPTFLVAVHIAWRSRNNTAEFFHNVAVVCWITANGIWMTGEFYFNDGLRSYAIVFFSIGILIVACYYLFYFPKRLKEQRARSNGNGQL